MTFHVAFSDEALRSVREIRDWIAAKSPKGAMKWLDALDQATARLAISPETCALAPEAAMFGNELRQILFKTRRGHTYRMLFIIRAQTVHVVAVRGASQESLQEGDIDLPE